MDSINERENRAKVIKVIAEGMKSLFWEWQCVQWEAERKKALEDLATIAADNIKGIATLQAQVKHIDDCIQAPVNALAALRKGV